MATHSSVLAWRIPGGFWEPGGLLSMGSHRVRHNWSDLTAAAAAHARMCSKVMLKILQARLQQYVNHELPDVQAGFRKGRETRDRIANICWIIKKTREFQKKNLLPFYWLSQRIWLCGSQQTGKFLKRWEYQTTWPASWEICMQVRSKLELDMGQQTGSK